MTTEQLTPASIRMSAMNLLAMREHSARELFDKLNRKFDSADLVANEVKKLTDEGLQSDQRFAEAFVNMRIRQGKGAIAIRLGLKEKGISDYVINNTLLAIDWDRLAVEAYIKKFGKMVAMDVKEKSKQMRFLAARGFSTSNIQYTFKNIANGEY